MSSESATDSAAYAAAYPTAYSTTDDAAAYPTANDSTTDTAANSTYSAVLRTVGVRHGPGGRALQPTWGAGRPPDLEAPGRSCDTVPTGRKETLWVLEPARGGMVGAAGQGNLSDERWRGTRLVPSTPTRGLPIPRHCDAGQNPPAGCMSQPLPPIFEIQKKNADIAL